MKKAILTLILAVALALTAAGFAEAAPVDLDLSVMPASIAYAQAVAMQREPAEYLGKTVRVFGMFNYSEARQRGVVIIADTTGCCETSLDFSCAEALRFPDDYPELYARLTVVGVFTLCEGEEYPLQLTDVTIEAF